MSIVHFVGAGPGDVELITLKGYRKLSQADVVIYAGSLVNPDLLQYCKEGAEIHDSASMHLMEIIDVMEEAVKAGKDVVRLQTEEMKKRGIEFDCIPGVSSFLGAASSIGTEYTVPEVSQSVIITRMAGRTPVPERESLRSYAQHRTSMAIFLSVQGIEKVVAELVEGGYPIETPVAVIYKATWPDERKVFGTLETIAERVKEAKIRKTALILVGDFLGEEFYYSKLYHKDFHHEFRKGLSSHAK